MLELEIPEENVQRKWSLGMDYKTLRCVRAKRRFKAVARLVIAHKYWLGVIEEKQLTDNVQKNIQLLTMKTARRRILTLYDISILNKSADVRSESDREHLNRILCRMAIFKRYPSHVKAQLAAVTYFQYFPAGRVILKQDQKAQAMYFLLSGELAVYKTTWDCVVKEFVTHHIATLKPGNMFGEVALLHNIPRTATVTTTTDCEMLRVLKEDFNDILKVTVLELWDRIKLAMRRFTYFDGMDEVAIRECCILAKMRQFSPNQTILGDDSGFSSYTHFILKGKCRVVETLLVESKYMNGKTSCGLYESPTIIGEEIEKKFLENLIVDQIEDENEEEEDEGVTENESELKEPSASNTKQFPNKSEDFEIKPVGSNNISGQLLKKSEQILSKSISSYLKFSKSKITTDKFSAAHITKLPQTVSVVNLPENVKTYFLQVCFYNELGCFNIGENMKHRRILAVGHVECLLIPRYWLIQHHNKGNVFSKVQQFLDLHVPAGKQLFNEHLRQRTWLKYRKKLVHDVLSSKNIHSGNTIYNVPFSIRINHE